MVGFGHDGGPILLLEKKPETVPPGASILGKDESGRFVIAYRRDLARVEMCGQIDHIANNSEVQPDAGVTEINGQDVPKEITNSKDQSISADTD